MSLLMKAAIQGERLIYAIGGLPVALRILLNRPVNRASPDIIRSAYAAAYWQGGWRKGAEIAAAALLWPVALLGGSLWFTARNGPVIRRRHRKGIASQFADQVRLYFTDGVLAPWYYIFQLHERGARAADYLQRFESKAGIYPLLRRGVVTELNDKRIFADYCAEKHIPCVPYLLHLDGEPPGGPLPDRDLFIKPANGRGGRGAERWDRVATGLFVDPDGRRVGAGELLDRLSLQARSKPLIVQERVEPHRDLRDLTSGALPTIRITTCLDEIGRPEVVDAVFRMAIGGNRSVDNLHAGGIASGVDLALGTLSSASNLGSDARLGWLDRHPDTGAAIRGRKLPCWDEAKALAETVHEAFGDRVLVGWDIAITDEGPVVVEGNSSPDLDIVQRFGAPVCSSRFGELLAWHLRQRGFA